MTMAKKVCGGHESALLFLLRATEFLTPVSFDVCGLSSALSLTGNCRPVGVPVAVGVKLAPEKKADTVASGGGRLLEIAESDNDQ